MAQKVVEGGLVTCQALGTYRPESDFENFADPSPVRPGPRLGNFARS